MLRQPTRDPEVKDKYGKTHLRGELQVDLDQLLGGLNLLLGVLELHRQVDEFGLHGKSFPPKDVQELTLLGILKDEPHLCRVLRAGPL